MIDTIIGSDVEDDEMDTKDIVITLPKVHAVRTHYWLPALVRSSKHARFFKIDKLVLRGAVS